MPQILRKDSAFSDQEGTVSEFWLKNKDLTCASTNLSCTLYKELNFYGMEPGCRLVLFYKAAFHNCVYSLKCWLGRSYTKAL